MMYGYGYGHGLGLLGFFGGFWMLIIWVLIIWLIVSLVRRMSGTHGGGCCGGGWHEKPNEQDQAMNVLRERFAKGEISEEEFENKSQLLKKN